MKHKSRVGLIYVNAGVGALPQNATMALFYFNVHDDDVTFGDEAFESVDEEAAREFAIQKGSLA